MHTGHTADHCPVFHDDMPSQARQTGHDHLVAQHAVVCNMGLRHNEVMRSKACTATRLHTAMDDDQFPDVVGITDMQITGAAIVLQVLGCTT